MSNYHHNAIGSADPAVVGPGALTTEAVAQRAVATPTDPLPEPKSSVVGAVGTSGTVGSVVSVERSGS
jgi:hypothetical protein